MSGPSVLRHRGFLYALSIAAAAAPAPVQAGCPIPPNECIGPWSDSGLPETISGVASAMVRYKGDLYVATQQVEGRPAGGIVRALGRQWVEVGGGLSSTKGEPALVDDMEVWDPDGPGPQEEVLVVVGRIDFAGPIGVQNIAIWDGFVWSTFGGGLAGNGSHLVEVWDRDGVGPLTPLLVATIQQPGIQKSVVSFATPASTPTSLGSFNADNGTLGEILTLEAIDTDGVGPGQPLLFIGGTIGGPIPLPGRPLKYLSGPSGTWLSAGNFPGNGGVIEVRGVASADLDGPDEGSRQLFAIGDNLHPFLAGSQSIAIANFSGLSTNWSVIPGAPGGWFPHDIVSLPNPTNPGVAPDLLFYAGSAEGNMLFLVANFAGNFVPLNLIGIGSVRDARPLAAGTPTGFDIAIAGDFGAPALPAIRNAAVVRILPGPLFNLFPPPLNTLSALWTADDVTALGRSSDPEFPDALLIAHTGQTFGGQLTTNLASWDGRQVGSLGCTLDPGARIRAVESLDFDGPGPGLPEVVIGGDFQAINGAALEALAVRRNGEWMSIFGDFAPRGGTLSSVNAIVDLEGNSFSPHNFFFAGSFASAGGVTSSNVGMFSATLGWLNDSRLNSGTNGAVRTAMLFNGQGVPGPMVVVGGEFTMAGAGVTTGPLAFFDLGNPGWHAVAGFSPGSVISRVLSWDHDGDDGTPERLIIAGNFTITSGSPLSHIASYNGDTFDAPGAPAMPGGLPLDGVFDAAVFDPDGPGPEPEWLVVAGATGTGCMSGVATPALLGLRPMGISWLPMRDAFNRSVCEGARRLFVHDDDASGPAGPALFLGGSGFNIEDSAALGIAKLPSVQPGLWIDCSVAQIDDPAAYACMIPADTDTPFVHDRTLLGRTSDSTYTVQVFFDHQVQSMNVRSDAVDIVVGNNRAQRGKPPALIVGPAPGSVALEVGGKGLPASLSFLQPAAIGRVDVMGDARVGTNLIDGLAFDQQQLSFENGLSADIRGELSVGSAGGKVLVDSAAQLVTRGVVRVGHDDSSNASITVRDASWFASDAPALLEIGGRGHGLLEVRNGAFFESTAQSFVLGSGPGGVGVLTVTNATLDLLGGPLTIGAVGSGTLSVEAGAQVSSSGSVTMNIGGVPGSSGLLSLLSDFQGTLWNGSGAAMFIGASGGAGRMYVQSSATIIMSSIRIGANGVLEGDGSVSAATTIGNGGVIDPGAGFSGGGSPPTPSTLSLFGAYEQVSAPDNAGIPGRLIVDIGGPNPGESDLLSIVGAADLGGHLDVRFVPGYVPAPDELGGGVAVLQADSIAGEFDVANFPGLPATLTGAPRFLRFETRPAVRGPGSIVVVVEDTLATPPPMSSESQDFEAGGAGADAALGDLDGDLDVDIAITIPDAIDPAGAPGSVVILFNAGTIGGFWQGFTSTTQITVEANPASILVADFDGINGNDIAYSTLSDDSIRVLLNDGMGNFAPLRGVTPPETVEGDPGHLIKSDFNLGGGMDIAVVTSDPSTVTVLFNSRDTDAAFTGFPVRETIPTPPTEVAGVASDIDNDKFDDIVVPDADDESATLIGNEGPRRLRGGLVFDPITVSLPVPGNPVDVDSADLDLDGFKDLAFASRASGAVSILLGQGTRTFLPALSVPAGSDPSRLVLSDLDNDADRDLAVVTMNEANQRVIRVVRNDLFGGQLGFAPQSDLEPGATPELILAGDITGDGQSDLVTVNDAGGVTALRGAGMANDVSVFTFAVCQGDGNNDGVVDMKDITASLTNWQTDYNPGTGPGDCDSNGVVDFKDVTCALSSFGRDCQ